MRDALYENIPYRLSELPHHYGPTVHLVGTPYQLSLLATLCSKDTVQPQVTALVKTLYADLLTTVLNAEFPRKQVHLPTRMIGSTPKGVYQGQVLDPDVRVVTVNIARAGSVPSQVVFEQLMAVLNPALVRQDHVVMSRSVDATDHVIGSAVGGLKIGGDVEEAIVLFPDPMGATGSSLSTAISLYKNKVPGTLKRVLCLNLVVTPEYLRRMCTEHPDVIVYALRLDRGLSPPEVFSSRAGEFWDQERGLDDRQYIVPGAGGMGEVLNNAYE